jgi:hypothetical protein
MEEAALVCDGRAMWVTLLLDYAIQEAVEVVVVALLMLFKKMVLLVALEWF